MLPVRFTREHEWIRVENGIGVVGITDYAQQQLGDVVYVELPAVGAAFAKGAQAAIVESVKAASEVYAPASGEIIAVNDGLNDEPGRVNADAMGDGWFFRIRLADASEVESLMDQGAYEDYLGSLE
jgi:glycine cleavage system H protein